MGARQRKTAAAPVAPLAAPGALTALLLAAMMFVAPAVGEPDEELLQDTLKSAVVAFFTLGAAWAFLWQRRKASEPARWHALVALPLLLMAYALGSMAWSHTYLGGVEAIRWFLFALLLWLGLNTLERERLPWLALGIHWGAVAASVWAALQFWFDLRWFPQGPNPGSTFLNRNFFAEFAVCTLPFSAWLLARARTTPQALSFAASGALVIVAIMMTGTRGALIALWLQLLVVLPLIGWRYRRQFDFAGRERSVHLAAGAALLVVIAALGVIPTGNQKIITEHTVEGRGLTPLQRAVNRTQSIRPDDHSLGIRAQMWKATLRVIEARPLAGVGAGAWENEVSRHQEEGAQLETDFYAHNEYLQLVAEYGVVGWVFLLLLIAYLVQAAWRTWREDGADGSAEAPLRAVALCSILAMLIVSAIGFPWRLAATGALLALALAVLAASDARLGLRSRAGATALPWRPQFAFGGLAATAVCFVLAAYITHQAAASEKRIVRAAKLALAISQSPSDPGLEPLKRQVLQLITEGVAINRHYRKITPIVADELARWGDWRNATWIWESVLSSRPYVVAIICNVGRGYLNLGDMAKAQAYLERARALQPRAPAVRSLEVIMLGRAGQDARAMELALKAIDEKLYDYDMVNAAFVLAARNNRFDLARQMLELRVREWPASGVMGYLQLAGMYARQANDPQQALHFYRRAVEATPPAQRDSLLAQMPPEFGIPLQREAAGQTSSSSR